MFLSILLYLNGVLKSLNVNFNCERLATADVIEILVEFLIFCEKSEETLHLLLNAAGGLQSAILNPERELKNKQSILIKFPEWKECKSAWNNSNSCASKKNSLIHYL